MIPRAPRAQNCRQSADVVGRPRTRHPDDHMSMPMRGTLANLIREAATQPLAPVPAVPPTPEDPQARYRRRFEYASPTPDQVKEWSRMLDRHRDDDDNPGECRACRPRPYPCHFYLSARAALAAAA